MAKVDSKKLDLLMSGCKCSTDIFKRAIWYDGEIFEHGTPRNDILVKSDSNLNGMVKEKLKIDKDKKIILYAPTFRKNNNLEIYNIDYSKIINKLKDKFGREWVFLVKLHPHLVSKSDELVYGKYVLDVTKYDDIQVATSDYAEQQIVLGKGATRISARELKLYVDSNMEKIKEQQTKHQKKIQRNFLEDRLDKDILSKLDNIRRKR